jgi:primary-amine oxidase
MSPPHPFDPLSPAEIEAAVTLVKKAHGDGLLFHVVTLQEPRKAAMTAWLEAPETAPRPARVAEIVVIENLVGTVYDGLVDITNGTITAWEKLSGMQPIVSTPFPSWARILSGITY